MKIVTLLVVAAMIAESFKPGILRYLFWTALLNLFLLATGSDDLVWSGDDIWHLAASEPN